MTYSAFTLIHLSSVLMHWGYLSCIGLQKPARYSYVLVKIVTQALQDIAYDSRHSIESEFKWAADI